MKTIGVIKPDWKWRSGQGSRELDRLLDRQLTFREKLEWLEGAESFVATSSRESRSALGPQERSPNSAQFERSSRTVDVTKDELYAHPGWQCCTFDGARKQVLMRGLQATFREKFEWLEEAETLSLRFQANRDSQSNQELLPRL